MEDAIAAGSTNQQAMSDALAALRATGRAYRAVGAVTEEDVDGMAALAELALYVRGNPSVTVGLSDVPAYDPVVRGHLRSVTATRDAVVELWEHAVVVRTTSGDDYELSGEVPAEHDWMEIRTNDGLVSVDLSTGVQAHAAEVRRREVVAADLAAIWAACAAPAAVAHDPDPRPRVAPPFEAIAVVAGARTITSISGSQLLHSYAPSAPAVEWITSPDGVHLVSGGVLVDPPVPPPPAPLRLVWIDEGVVSQVELR